MRSSSSAANTIRRTCPVRRRDSEHPSARPHLGAHLHLTRPEVESVLPLRRHTGELPLVVVAGHRRDNVNESSGHASRFLYSVRLHQKPRAANAVQQGSRQIVTNDEKNNSQRNAMPPQWALSFSPRLLSRSCSSRPAVPSYRESYAGPSLA